jgi:hypothetical protein
MLQSRASLLRDDACAEDRFYIERNKWDQAILAEKEQPVVAAGRWFPHWNRS